MTPIPDRPAARGSTGNALSLRPISVRPPRHSAAKKLRSQRRDPASDDEPDPESNSALLRQHLYDQSDSEDDHDEWGHDDRSSTTLDLPSFLGRLVAFMSKTPLLLRSAPGFGAGSYGAAPISGSAENSDDDDSRIYAGRSRERGNGSSNLRYATVGSSASRRSRKSPGPNDSQRIRMRPSRSNMRSKRVASEPVAQGPFDERPATAPIPVNPGEPVDEVDSDESEAKDDTRREEESSISIDSEDPDDDDEDPPDNSAYAAVRASVSAVDNTTLSINTPRMWVLSMLFAMAGSGTNLFFSLRYPSVAITPIIALLLVHPLGLMWDSVLKRKGDPTEVFVHGVLRRRTYASRAGSPNGDAASLSSQQVTETEDDELMWNNLNKWTRLRLWLAQGRWNEKEHSCVYISSNVSFGFAFATDVIVEQTQFYKQDVTITYQVLLILSTQILGYTFAGLARRFLVRPGGMIWPGTLASVAMFTTLHKEENKPANGWRITRWKFFFIVWIVSFLFYFLPGLLFPALSYFNVVTWFAPRNVVVANLFGVSSGLGLFPVTFDWAQIAYIGSPLLTPFWAAMNVVGGLVLVMWIIAPIAYYKNLLYSSYMPILSSSVFDNTGKVYDVSKILTDNFLFDKEAYQNYSRVFLPITYVLSYGLQFAALASLLTHTSLWHGRDIWRQWRRSLEEVKGENKADYEPLPRSTARNLKHRASDPRLEAIMSSEDVHNRLMRRYPDAPLSWYLWTFVTMTAVGMFVVEHYPVHLPWYGLLLALGICTILFIPIGIVMAITNQHSSIYLICQLVAGAVFPGRPVANMVFTTYGYISSAQGVKFSADLKLGHYMKIPPRILFSVQMVATIISSITQIGVLNWMFAYVPGICTSQAINGFTCPLARVHFNGSILWGVVGPSEFFGPGATYHPLVWCFLIGAVAPIPLWLYGRNRKHSIIRKINLPVLFGSLSWIPPATGLNFSVWAVVCYVFNHLIAKRHSVWWAKYTMTLSAALDSGLAFGLVVVFFGFVYPGFMDNFKWWGTEVYKMGCDWQACPYKEVATGTHFGPDTW